MAARRGSYLSMTCLVLIVDSEAVVKVGVNVQSQSKEIAECGRGQREDKGGREPVCRCADDVRIRDSVTRSGQLGRPFQTRRCRSLRQLVGIYKQPRAHSPEQRNNATGALDISVANSVWEGIPAWIPGFNGV